MSQVAVVTGANRGIGLALVAELLKRDCEVYGVCRHASSELQSSGARVIEGIDIHSAEGAKALQKALAGVEINILVNNAGIMRDEKFGQLNYDTMVEQFEVNALGALRVSEALVEQMSKPGKLALITSRMGSIADNTSGGRYGYRMSKAALNAAGKSLAHDLKGQGIAVAILHPGFVQTDMVGGGGHVSPGEAAQMLVDRIAALSADNSGTFWHANGEELPW